MDKMNEELYKKIMDDALTKQITARSIKDASMEELEEIGHTRYYTTQFFENTIKELIEVFEQEKI